MTESTRMRPAKPSDLIGIKEWINCHVKLPPANVKILIAQQMMSPTSWSIFECELTDEEIKYLTVSNVTHWQPFPEAQHD